MSEGNHTEAHIAFLSLAFALNTFFVYFEKSRDFLLIFQKDSFSKLKSLVEASESQCNNGGNADRKTKVLSELDVLLCNHGDAQAKILNAITVFSVLCCLAILTIFYFDLMSKINPIITFSLVTPYLIFLCFSLLAFIRYSRKGKCVVGDYTRFILKYESKDLNPPPTPPAASTAIP